ncbi:hypothetical protein CEE69_07430 [Rhodopirellula bahusiensis]|uniref:Uncharacterized protein n=1 Tax=Rhodopirellula bahusiensis TaxID=2014065 RepID=A0A2G1WAF1_9BACT|nr:hypothetical protein CEE69_07430 [Rhodopirellula bahusiensis]
MIQTLEMHVKSARSGHAGNQCNSLAGGFKRRPAVLGFGSGVNGREAGMRSADANPTSLASRM